MKPQLLLACLWLPLTCSFAHAGRIDLFLVAGQSNQVAFQAPASSLPLELQSQTDVIFRGTTGLVTTLQPQDDRFGPEMTFARSTADARALLGLPPIGISKYAVGSTNLAIDWNPGEYNGDPGIGVRYKNMISRALGTANLLRKQGYQPRWAGMLWLQGETDANDLAMATAYGENLHRLIQRVRSDLLTKFLPVSIAEIHAPFRRYRDLVRQHQEEVAATTPNVFIFDTDDLALVDKVHFGPDGIMEIGRRYALTFPVSTTSTSSIGSTSVPEPAVGSLMAVLAVLGITRWLLKRRCELRAG